MIHWEDSARILANITRIDEYTYADDAPYRPDLTTGPNVVPPFAQSAITDAWHENPFLRPDLKVSKVWYSMAMFYFSSNFKQG